MTCRGEKLVHGAFVETLSNSYGSKMPPEPKPIVICYEVAPAWSSISHGGESGFKTGPLVTTGFDG